MKQLLSLCLLAIGTIGFTQTSGTLKGTVLDDKGEAIPMVIASVEIGGESIKARTDFDGKFTIKPLNSGTYILTLASLEHDTARYQIQISPDQITFEKNLVMSSKVGREVVITANKLIDPEETSKITLTAKAIKNSPLLRDPAALISSMSTDIKKSEDGELYFRGSRSGGIVQFIDGVKQTGTISGLPGRAIGRVSVYTGGIPAKYGDTTSGVIVLETKSYFDLYYARMAGNE